jgi:hypothetical protein
LSEVLARAVAGKLKMVAGEARCHGVRHNKELKKGIPCQNLLRYKLSMGF